MANIPANNGDFVEYRRLILDQLNGLNGSYKELLDEVTKIRVEIATIKTRMQMQAAVVAAVISPIMSFIVTKVLV